MKKFALCIALAFVLVMGVSSTSMATGVTLDIDGWCNNLWLSVASEASGVYSCHGYEYGCGAVDRMVDGVLHVTGGVAYFGLAGCYGGVWDFGGLKVEPVVINVSSKQGQGYWSYHYISGGTLTGHGGGPDAYTMTVGVPPQAPAEAGALEPDTAAQ